MGLWGSIFFKAAAALWGRQIAAAVSTLATVWLTGAGQAGRAHMPGAALAAVHVHAA